MNLKFGTRFSTKYESGCIVTQEPNKFGEFLALDSDGVECQFNTEMTLFLDERVTIEFKNTHGIAGAVTGVPDHEFRVGHQDIPLKVTMAGGYEYVIQPGYEIMVVM